MRNRIKEVARGLLIEHGYRGFRFGDISNHLEITRANIHYHFGTKSRLIDEVICEYVDQVLEILTGIWDADSFYADKVLSTMEFNRSRYLAMNPPGSPGRPWSLISRMRLEAPLLSDVAKERLQRFSGELTALIGSSVEKANSRGEFAPNAPLKDITLQMVIIVDSAGSLTMDAGSFSRLEHLYLAHLRLVTLGYGGRAAHAELSSTPSSGDDLGQTGRRPRRSKRAETA